MFWETKTWNREKVSWKKLTEMLICLNIYLFLVTQRPKKNVLRLGFVFFAELASQSDDHIETCDIFLEKHLCRCYDLQKRFDVRVATTQSRNLKHAKCHNLDLKRSITNSWFSFIS